MPVRIYDISKKLGLDNKQVLAKAKALSLTAARVASSSLDKITAEYLELEILKDPELAALRLPPAPPPAPPAPPAALPPTVDQAPAVTGPSPPVEVETAQKPEVITTAGAPSVETAAPAIQTPTPVSQTPPPSVAPAVTQLPPEPTPEPTPELPPPPPPPPLPPPGPKVGDKVGFIQLRPKPGGKTTEKSLSPKLPSRPGELRKTEFARRGDIRGVRGATAAPAGPAMPGARLHAPHKGTAAAKAAEPAGTGPKVLLPPDAQVISIKPPIVVRELAEQLKQKPFKIIADLMEAGVFANVNQAIDESVAQRICCQIRLSFRGRKTRTRQRTCPRPG